MGTSTGYRLLVVEDDADTRCIMEKLLALEGYQSVTASSLAEAREALGRQKFDAMLCDLGLPDGDACELMRHALASRKGGPRGIAITGWTSSDVRQRAIEAGFEVFLHKPVDFTMLKRTIASVLEPAAPAH